MFCKKCGAQIKDGSGYCTQCGAAIYDDIREQKPGKDGNNHSVIAVGAIVAIAVFAVVLFVFVVLPTMRGSDDSTPGLLPNSGDVDGSPSLDLHISQVDNSAFPKMTLYASIESEGEQLSSASPEQFSLTEIGNDGSEHVATIDEIAPLVAGDAMNINLVLDQSGSMNGSKMSSAQSAASSFVDVITSTEGNEAEITAFNDNVYCVQPFTSDKTLLKSAISSLRTDGETALFDALYWALQRANLKSGSSVVIAFTDGAENASYYGLTEVVELSRMTGIPVYIIGIGDSIDRTGLQSIASQCNGSYFDASVSNLQEALQNIYEDIYASQRGMYRVVYTSSYTGDESQYRAVRLACSDSSGYSGSTETSYMPIDNVSSYETMVHSQDYVLPDSGTRYYSKAELEKLSLWELYLARNEIFARYGRGFKKQDLVDYFATRRWYHQTATPEEFDSKPSPLNDYEQKNTQLMLEIEKARNSPYLTM